MMHLLTHAHKYAHMQRLWLAVTLLRDSVHTGVDTNHM